MRLVLAILWFAHLLPLPVLAAIGRVLGGAAWHLARERRMRRAERTLRTSQHNGYFQKSY